MTKTTRGLRAALPDWEVRAFLLGRKKTFRAVIDHDLLQHSHETDVAEAIYDFERGEIVIRYEDGNSWAIDVPFPFGAVHSTIDVQEAWASPGPRGVAYRADGLAGTWVMNEANRPVFQPCGQIRSLTREIRYPLPEASLSSFGGRWFGAQQMPGWACRLRLEVIEAGVERLQSIDDLRAIVDEAPEDGFWDKTSGTMKTSAGTETRDDWITGNARDAFARAWNSTRRKAGSRWEDNPWVWVVRVHTEALAAVG